MCHEALFFSDVFQSNRFRGTLSSLSCAKKKYFLSVTQNLMENQLKQGPEVHLSFAFSVRELMDMRENNANSFFSPEVFEII